MGLPGALDPGRRVDEGGTGFPNEGADPGSERSAARLDGRGVGSPRNFSLPLGSFLGEPIGGQGRRDIDHAKPRSLEFRHENPKGFPVGGQGEVGAGLVEFQRRTLERLGESVEVAAHDDPGAGSWNRPACQSPGARRSGEETLGLALRQREHEA